MKPSRNSKYLQWIRTLPCLVCGSIRSIEAAHTGHHGLGQKSPDSSAIPLCPDHHRIAEDCYHKLGPRKFAAMHNLNIRTTVALLSTKPVIRIVSGNFVGLSDHEEFRLGSLSDGLEQAIRRIVGLRRTAVRQRLHQDLRQSISQPDGSTPGTAGRPGRDSLF